MKIFSAEQVRQWEAYTIEHEPISSLNLMERAATACFDWLINHFDNGKIYIVFCGTGNNGGDGLAIARMLLYAGKLVSIYILEGSKRSEEFKSNLERIEPMKTAFHFISNVDFPIIPAGAILIDALFGSGLNRPLQAISADLVNYMNRSGNKIVSIDIPTGLFAETQSEGNAIIRANHTLGFQINKLAFFMAENNQYTGIVHLFDIGLHPYYYKNTPTLFYATDREEINSIYKPRNQFAHKYDFGHVLLYAGSKNMMGAAIISAKACLRIGAGLVTVFTEENTQPVLQASLPEAITTTDYDFERLSKKKSAIGIGPGLALSGANKDLLKNIISGFSGPLVIDASALEMLATEPEILKQRKFNPAILTPHTGEFEKLFGKTSNDLERMKLALEKSNKLGCYIVLKGHHTLVACPDGKAFFNTTGNAGMATAGSGDALTGILTGLLAQGYSQLDACLLGVYLHGMAGDVAAEKMSQEAMIAGDIIDCIGEAYKTIKFEKDLAIQSSDEI